MYVDTRFFTWLFWKHFWSSITYYWLVRMPWFMRRLCHNLFNVCKVLFLVQRIKMERDILVPLDWNERIKIYFFYWKKTEENYNVNQKNYTFYNGNNRNAILCWVVIIFKLASFFSVVLTNIWIYQSSLKLVRMIYLILSMVFY